MGALNKENFRHHKFYNLSLQQILLIFKQKKTILSLNLTKFDGPGKESTFKKSKKLRCCALCVNVYIMFLLLGKHTLFPTPSPFTINQNVNLYATACPICRLTSLPVVGTAVWTSLLTTQPSASMRTYRNIATGIDKIITAALAQMYPHKEMTTLILSFCNLVSRHSV